MDKMMFQSCCFQT